MGKLDIMRHCCCVCGAGSIPGSLGGLSELKSLDLEGNLLEGEKRVVLSSVQGHATDNAIPDPETKLHDSKIIRMKNVKDSILRSAMVSSINLSADA